ncbi:MAG TPA: DUF6498-containing protein [Steroidobacteraceae bacterium]|nr:DUF6498-containing protein [Steroidobacteraceae bacterium]
MKLKERLSLPIVFLVLSNLVPVVGVVLWHWDVAAILILYWSENLIIGASTVIKVIARSPIGGPFSSLFFVLHYGGFCAVHGMMLLAFLLHVKDPFGKLTWPLWFAFLQLLLNVMRQVFELAPREWIYAFLSLCVSHAVSLIYHFFIKGERERVTGQQLMAAPYSRILVLHLAVLFGGWGVMALNSPMPLLIVLIVGKIVLDLSAHIKEHRTSAKGNEAKSPSIEPRISAAQ